MENDRTHFAHVIIIIQTKKSKSQQNDLRVWYSNTNFLKHVREFQSSKSERGLLNFQFYALRLFIFRREADKRRRSRLLFLRPQNAAKPHFSAVKMKSETVKLKIKSSALAFGALKFKNVLLNRETSSFNEIRNSDSMILIFKEWIWKST